MMAAMTLPVLVIVGGAMVLVRLGWGGRRGFAALGWSLVAAALTVLTLRDGAWGLAIGAVTAIAAALAMVLYAGWRSPVRPIRPARVAPEVAYHPRVSDIARRLAVFALVVPVAFVATLWFTFGAQAIARRAGMGDADAIALTLFLQPVLWCAVMTIQMTRAATPAMIVPPVVATALGTLLWSLS